MTQDELSKLLFIEAKVGALNEREKIVRFLVGCAKGEGKEHVIIGALANAIERGEHEAKP